MTKKLHLLTLTILLFSFLFSNSQNANKNFNKQELKNKVDEIIASKNSRVSIPTGSKVLNYLQNGFGIDLNSTLSNIGFTVTDEVGNGNIQTALVSDTWDLVIIQAHDVSLLATEVTAISDYINNGGKLIISYWGLNDDITLQGILGISNTISISSPINVTAWDATHDIFTNPNTVGNLTTIGDNGGTDNGDKLEPAVGATALAGFTATPTTNEAAIILSNNNHVIFHGFAGIDMDLTSFTNLIENEAEYLVVPTITNVLDYRQGTYGVDLNPMLTDNGYTVTSNDGSGNIDTLLDPTANWDIVILQVHNSNLTTNEISAIGNYVSNGGKLIMSYWALNIETSVQPIVGVSSVMSFSSPINVSLWDSSHTIFTSPNTISDFNFTGDNAGGDNGDRLQIGTGAIALAGFVSTDTSGEAAIVLANNNKTIYHGFGAADYNATIMEDLFENEIDFLLNNSTASIQNTDLSIALNAYPNPTTGEISINLGEAFNNVTITTSNILGQTIDIQKFNTVSEINNFYIKGNAGTYFINIQAENGKRASLKIIKK